MSPHLVIDLQVIISGTYSHTHTLRYLDSFIMRDIRVRSPLGVSCFYVNFSC